MRSVGGKSSIRFASGFPGVVKWDDIILTPPFQPAAAALENGADDRRVRFQLGRALQRVRSCRRLGSNTNKGGAGTTSAMSALGWLYANGQGVDKTTPKRELVPESRR